MKYAQIQQLAKALKNQGVIAKKFNLSQKAEILIAEIQKNITKVLFGLIFSIFCKLLIILKMFSSIIFKFIFIKSFLNK